MLRLVTFFIVILALAVGAAWLADRPGTVALEWQGYVVELGVMTAAIGLIALVLVAIFLHGVWRAIMRGPGIFGDFLRGRRRDKGYRSLSKGMIAIGAGDAQAARRFADQAAQLLPNEPMTKLLKAQAAQAGGSRDEAAKTFNAMLESPDTRLLGLRGLFLEAKRNGDKDAARHYASEALGLAPGVPWAGTAMFEFQCASGDWEGALKTLQTQTERQVVDKATARRRRAVLLTALGLELEDGEPDKALALAGEAHGLDMSLVAAATLTSRLATRLGNIRRASSVIEQSWRVNPHPELAEAYSRVRPGDSVRDRYRRIKGLAQKATFHRESKLALSAAAIDAKDWKTARQTLMTLAKKEPTVRVCELMARVEEGEHGDKGRAREWLARAVHALPDPVWTADGRVSDVWLPVSPVSGRLDAFEWKVPVEALAPLPATVVEALGAPVEAPVQAAPEKPVVPVKPDRSAPAAASATGAAAAASAAPTAADTVAANDEKADSGNPPPAPAAAAARKPDDSGKDNVDKAETTVDPTKNAAKPADGGQAAAGDAKRAADAGDGKDKNSTVMRLPDDPGPDDPGFDADDTTMNKRLG